jgi:hypothetical protein
MMGDPSGRAWVGLEARKQHPRALIESRAFVMPPRSDDGSFVRRVDERLLSCSFDRSEGEVEGELKCLGLEQLYAIETASGLERLSEPAYFELLASEAKKVRQIHVAVVKAIEAQLKRCVGHETYDALLLLSGGCLRSEGGEAQLLSAIEAVAQGEPKVDAPASA